MGEVTAEENDDTIVRLYECHNRRSKVRLTFCQELIGAAECTLLEEELEQVPVEGNGFSFVIEPYEIKTFRLKVGAPQR